MQLFLVKAVIFIRSYDRLKFKAQSGRNPWSAVVIMCQDKTLESVLIFELLRLLFLGTLSPSPLTSQSVVSCDETGLPSFQPQAVVRMGFLLQPHRLSQLLLGVDYQRNVVRAEGGPK